MSGLRDGYKVSKLLGGDMGYHRKKVLRINQTEMAQRVGISTNYLSKIERGLATISHPVASALLRELEWDTDEPAMLVPRRCTTGSCAS